MNKEQEERAIILFLIGISLIENAFAIVNWFRKRNFKKRRLK